MTTKRFLIINPYGIGDVLFTVPMIKTIKANVADAFIGYVANSRTAPLLQSIPEVNCVTIYDRDEFKAVSDRSKSEFLRLLKKTKDEISAAQYDICFDLSMTGYAAFYCMIAGIKERVGLNYRNRSVFLTKKILLKGFEGRHVVEYYLDLLRVIGFDVQPQTMELLIPTEKRMWVKEFLRQAELPKENFLVVFPGGGESWGHDAKFKRWPAIKYAELISKVFENFNVEIILMGNRKEESLCKEIQSLVKYPLFNACGQTDLLQTMAILHQSALAVVNDGGPLHMAVAAGTRTVSVFGPVDEKVYGPYSDDSQRHHRVVTTAIACRPCYRNFRRAACEHISCIKDVEVEKVFSAVANLLIGDL